MMQDIQPNKDESFTPQLQVLSNFGQILQIAPNTCQAIKLGIRVDNYNYEKNSNNWF
jgi:hypothetical protein